MNPPEDNRPLVTCWQKPEGKDNGMGMRAERRRIRGLLRELGLPPHPTLDQVHAAYEVHTQRTLQLIDRDVSPGEPSGQFEQYLTHDLIYYPKHTSRAHQMLVICHELAHLILGHLPAHQAIDPDVVRRVLGRSHYADPAEHEAETVGTLLFQQLNLSPDDGPAARIAPSLAHREGRHV
ncbi:ImmA/IrrE family metallo-endopeptidase [Streptomyces hygroscopicus]|uniref:IrrE N-terminal-like domain-containing protein n=1 Tax=Streptomyces demainii TaxID=588122 RepID=A0ABT9KHA7_9ACTN|nr:ImmA/IrrE family metallo-endopeptidase [Streptomyces demainii]MDP9607811.1 hypothetical protein [Streptomyces demainii]